MKKSSVWSGVACAVAGTASSVVGLAVPSHAEVAALRVVTNLGVYQNAAGGQSVVEDFTDTDHFPLTACRLDSGTEEGGLRAGDLEAGAVYSTHCSGAGFELNIDAGSFEGGFLDGFHHGERTDRRALRVAFTRPVSAFGFDTNAHMGRSFKVRVVHTDGRVQVLDGLQVTAGRTEEQFYGFVSGAADIARIRIAGQGGPTFGFALDDFRFNPAA